MAKAKLKVTTGLTATASGRNVLVSFNTKLNEKNLEAAKAAAQVLVDQLFGRAGYQPRWIISNQDDMALCANVDLDPILVKAVANLPPPVSKEELARRKANAAFAAEPARENHRATVRALFS